MKKQALKKQLQQFEVKQLPVSKTDKVKGGDGGGTPTSIVVVDVIIP